MHMQNEPQIDAWYRDAAGRVFQVVAVDPKDNSVELQHFSGEVEEINLGSWYGMELESIDPPEDWTGPFDDLERDDRGETGYGARPEDWNGPWDELDREG
jgi:hypothetical protein